jgi:hypothetical protein
VLPTQRSNARRSSFVACPPAGCTPRTSRTNPLHRQMGQNAPRAHGAGGDGGSNRLSEPLVEQRGRGARCQARAGIALGESAPRGNRRGADILAGDALAHSYSSLCTSIITHHVPCICTRSVKEFAHLAPCRTHRTQGVHRPEQHQAAVARLLARLPRGLPDAARRGRAHVLLKVVVRHGALHLCQE